MATIEVNGAHLHYEAFGVEAPGSCPVILIHGALATGEADWGALAPALGLAQYVIVPDCRGHGQSDNPAGGYSFTQMAADIAGLVRGLGYERAHIVGHSNGGNVALVTLLEHPQVVQTCVIQAANAYVSPDLRTREPIVLDPDRITREDQAWMERMIALHDAGHGQGYWRELLRMTLAEILAGPNCTPADLAGVQRPVLVIQGELDPVNAPAGHAGFIAQHIPHAELWAPTGAGHDVQRTLPATWLARVQGFWERRGDDANEALYRLGRTRYADERETLFAVRLTGGQHLTGLVLEAEQRTAALAAVSPHCAAAVHDELRVLMEGARWALAQRPVSDVRREPRRSSERLTQVLLGEPVQVLDEQGDWVRVRLERDGYLGWVQIASLHSVDRAEAAAYASACDCTVLGELAPAYSTAPAPSREALAGNEAGKLPFGVRVPLVDEQDGWCGVRLPDGSTWWVAREDLAVAGERPIPDASGIAYTLSLICRAISVPYLWGGRSAYGYDCSGLAQTFLGYMGIAAPRDADQQYRAGGEIHGLPQPGDLLFFGESDRVDAATDQRYARITHVAIALGADEFIHANGSAGGVSYNSFDPASGRYRAWLREHFVGARRYT